MQTLTAEFWAIVAIGLLVWFGVIRGIGRVAALLGRIETDVCLIKAIMEEAPWVAIQPEDLTEFLVGDRVRPFLRRRGD